MLDFVRNMSYVFFFHKTCFFIPSAERTLISAWSVNSFIMVACERKKISRALAEHSD